MIIRVETSVTLNVKDNYIKKHIAMELDDSEIEELIGSSKEGTDKIRTAFDFAANITSNAAWDSIEQDMDVLLEVKGGKG